MSERTLSRLLAVLGVLVLAWAGFTFVGGGNGGGDAEIPEEVRAILRDLSPETLETVRARGPETDLELARTGEGWSVNGHRPDSSNLELFWNALEGAEVEELVATNPANHPRMGVAADSALQVEIEAGGETRTFLLGNQGPRYGTAYMRLPDDDRVWLVDGQMAQRLRQNLDQWRDKRMVAADTAAVERIEVSREGGGWTAIRSDSVWVLQDGTEADGSTMRTVLGQLANLRASGFLAEGDSLAGLPEAATVTALTAAGDTLARVTLAEGEGDRWARAAGDPVLYRLSSFRADRLAPPEGEVRGGG